jgi:hypothetical protein
MKLGTPCRTGLVTVHIGQLPASDSYNSSDPRSHTLVDEMLWMLLRGTRLDAEISRVTSNKMEAMTLHETRRVKCPRRCARLSRGKWGAIGNGGVQRKVTLRSLDPAVRMAGWHDTVLTDLNSYMLYMFGRLRLGVCISNASRSDVRNSAYSRLGLGYGRKNRRYKQGTAMLLVYYYNVYLDNSGAMITIHVQSWTSHQRLSQTTASFSSED